MNAGLVPANGDSMTINDAFTAQIVKLVRQMPDDAILALVRDQLGLVKAHVAGAVSVAAPGRKRGRKPGRPAKAKPAAKPKAAPVAKAAAPVKAVAAPVAKAAPVKAAPAKAAKVAPAKRGPKPGAPKKAGTRIRRSGAELQKALEVIERAVKAGRGLAVGQIVKSTGMKKASVVAALKELRGAKRIFLAGDRRFARYAGDARTAELASTTARKGGK